MNTKAQTSGSGHAPKAGTRPACPHGNCGYIRYGVNANSYDDDPHHATGRFDFATVGSTLFQ